MKMWVDGVSGGLGTPTVRSKISYPTPKKCEGSAGWSWPGTDGIVCKTGIFWDDKCEAD